MLNCSARSARAPSRYRRMMVALRSLVIGRAGLANAPRRYQSQCRRNLASTPQEGLGPSVNLGSSRRPRTSFGFPGFSANLLERWFLERGDVFALVEHFA